MASLFFYGAWNFRYIALIMGSIGVNYIIAGRVGRRKGMLTLGVLFNVALLFYYKYCDFFIENVSAVFGVKLPLMHVLLPLGISFFTFQKIAYLVDAYKGKVKNRNFTDFCLFVTFFPQLISGPIVHHSEVIPQFNERKCRQISWVFLAAGAILFSIGLFKKVVIADVLYGIVAEGYSRSGEYSFWAAWMLGLAYTLQIYFDFSGYTDMALGAALMLNIRLPANFNSPYKAKNITDFWRRWHMTLSRWLREYVYIPLGGNRNGYARTLANIFVTFTLGGIWHGANWTFVIWGVLHGGCVLLHKIWLRVGLRMFSWIAAPMLFVFITVAWVFFRADTVGKAVSVLRGMINWGSASSFGDAMSMVDSGLSHTWLSFLCGSSGAAAVIVGFLLFLTVLVFFVKNSNEMVESVLQDGNRVSLPLFFLGSTLMVVSIFIMIYRNISPSPFIYYSF